MIGIIVLNYNTYEETKRCVLSIVSETKNCEYKIFVVDNNSKDNSYEKLKKEFIGYKNIKVLETGENEGYSAGNNFVCNNIDVDIYDKLCIVNSDVIFNNNAIKIMQDAFQGDIAVVGPSVLSVDGTETQLLRKPYDFWMYLVSKKPLYYLRNYNDKFKTEYQYTKDKFVFEGMVRGCCFMIDSKKFKDIGFFDENVFLYSEEWIIAWKLKMLKLKTCFFPEASISHLDGKSTGKYGVGFQSLHLYLSAFYYLKYYVKINVIELIFVYFQNTLVFLLRSLVDKSYRENLKIYMKYANRLLFARRIDKIRIRNK